MFYTIRKAIIKHKLLTRAERERRIDELCYQSARRLVMMYRQYDVLDEVEQLCNELDEEGVRK